MLCKCSHFSNEIHIGYALWLITEKVLHTQEEEWQNTPWNWSETTRARQRHKIRNNYYLILFNGVKLHDILNNFHTLNFKLKSSAEMNRYTVYTAHHNYYRYLTVSTAVIWSLPPIIQYQTNSRRIPNFITRSALVKLIKTWMKTTNIRNKIAYPLVCHRAILQWASDICLTHSCYTVWSTI